LETGNSLSVKLEFAEEWYRFVGSILIPSFSEPRQIEIMGAVSPGCAWELLDDIKSHGDCILNSWRTQLTTLEAKAVSSLVEFVKAVPVKVTNTTGMNDPFWVAFNQEVEKCFPILISKNIEACSVLNIELAELYS